ncbi:hypothetical protein ACXZ1K_15905 [Pedobacter sp. PWIIR3]
MQPIPSTAQVLAYKILNRVTDKVWIDWAYEMLIAGYDTEHLLILAGMSMPLEHFEMQKLTSKVFSELDLDYSDTDRVLTKYASYLASESLNNDLAPMIVLSELKNIYLELDHCKPLQDFYLLFYAKVDLLDSEDQWYINGVDRSNIDATIANFFKEWVT